MVRILTLLTLIAGCGGNIDGAWTGTWTSITGASGGVDAELDSADEQVSGTFNFTNSPCFSAAAVDAVLADDELSGSATAGGIRIDFSATLTNDDLNGTYQAVSAGLCTGDLGTFSLERD